MRNNIIAEYLKMNNRPHPDHFKKFCKELPGVGDGDQLESKQADHLANLIGHMSEMQYQGQLEIASAIRDLASAIREGRE